MDLVAGVRKEGSRGGRDSFKWSDVKQSSHRENYLGHSIMAPVGRWQQNRDLNWYAKSGDVDKAKQERQEEIRRIKEAEQDAMALALGLPVAPRASNNANLTPLGGQEVRKAVQEATEGDGDGDGDGGRGIGFGSYGGIAGNDAEDEILAPIGMVSAVRPLGQEKDGRDRHRSRRERSRDHDRRRDRDHRDRDRDRGGRHRHDRDADREHRHRHHREHREHREHRRHRSRSRSVSRSPRPELRDQRPEADRRRDAGRSERHRSSSPRRDRERDRGDHESGRDAHHRHHRR